MPVAFIPSLELACSYEYLMFVSLLIATLRVWWFFRSPGLREDNCPRRFYVAHAAVDALVKLNIVGSHIFNQQGCHKSVLSISRPYFMRHRLTNMFAAWLLANLVELMTRTPYT